MLELNSRAKVLALGELAAAVVVCAFALTTWTSSGAGTFLILLGLSAASGAMKVVLPRVAGNLSASYLFLVWGIVRMGLGETLLMGWAATAVQSYWHCKTRPSATQLLFNWSLITLSIGTASATFKLPFMQDLVPDPLLRVLAASFSYFLVNTLSVAGMNGLTKNKSIWNVWRTSYLWSFPHYLVSASLVAAVQYLERAFGREVALLILPPAYLVYQVFTAQVQRLEQALARAEADRRHSEEISQLHFRSIRSLALAIEAKDRTTAEHLHRVQTYAMGLAEEFGLPPNEMEALRAAAILHDVGKIAVPESIISKPGKLTPEEFKAMKIHTVVGAEIVASMGFPYAVEPLVRGHHEKWDGSGYPDGLKGEEIPLGARILTAVDCLDALASDRQYRRAMPLDKAMAIIVAESGKSFDPRVVGALQRRCNELENLAKSTLPPSLTGFSVDANVERGAAPDAGYATGSPAASQTSTSSAAEIIHEVEVLNLITRQIGQGASIEADLTAVEVLLHQLIPFECIGFYRARGDRLECTFANGECSSMLLGLSIESGTGPSGWTIATRTPLLNGNAVTELGRPSEAHSAFTLGSSLSIPVESEFGPLGVVTLYSRQPNAFQSSHLRALLAVSSRLGYQTNLDCQGFREILRDCPQEDAVSMEVARLCSAVRSDGVSSMQPFSSST